MQPNLAKSSVWLNPPLDSCQCGYITKLEQILFKTFGYNNYCVFTFANLKIQQIRQCCLGIPYTFKILPLAFLKNFNVLVFLLNYIKSDHKVG